MYLDPKGRDASLLAKKLKEHIAETQSRKQKKGERRFVELHEQIERLVAELPPAKERTEEQKAELQSIIKEKCKMKKKLENLKRATVAEELAEEDQVEHTVEHSQENSLHTPT